jgi:hypothetical protein
VSNLSFEDIQVTAAEGGVFLAGGPLPHTIAGGPARDAHRANRRQLHELLQQRQWRRQKGERREAPPQLHSLQGIRLERVSLVLRRLTAWPGGCQDYRPSSNASTLPCLGGNSARGSSSSSSASPFPGLRGGSGSGGGSPGWWPAGLDCGGGGTPAVWVAGADDVRLVDVQVRTRHGTAGLNP